MIATSLIRAGVVSAVVPERAAVVVAFSDRDNLVSKELPVLFPQTIHAMHYALPAVNESALCVFLGNGMEVGFYIGSFYTSVDRPPVVEASKQGVWFADGSYCEFDTSTGKLTVDAKGSVHLRAVGGVTIEGDLTVTGQIRGNFV